MSPNGIKKVAVLMGGVSSEREISLSSGENVAASLENLGKYEVKRVILNSENLDALGEDVDAAYIALHGGWGENGGVQAALDSRRIPYTGPGAFASRLAMDKIKTKLVLEMNNVPTANWSLACAGTPKSPLALPVVVKPPCDGSSVGISKVSKPEDWQKALEEALAAQGGEGNILVEEYIPGREMTVAIIDSTPLPVIEIVANGGWYGWQEKYESNETRYPFLLDEASDAKTKALSDELQSIALKAYKALGCRGVARVDFRVSPLGRAYILEINTSPGFTSHSLVPKAGMKTGLSLGEVAEKILLCAKFDSSNSNCI